MAEMTTMGGGGNVSDALSKVSIYLDGDADAYLERVRIHARGGQPRVDATRSAIVRLALNRLAKQSSVDQVVEDLRGSSAIRTVPGRKRR